MFQKLQKKIKEFFGEKGQGVVEYAMILGFVGIIALALFSSGGLKEKVNSNMTAVGGELDAMANEINGSTTAIHKTTGS